MLVLFHLATEHCTGCWHHTLRNLLLILNTLQIRHSGCCHAQRDKKIIVIRNLLVFITQNYAKSFFHALSPAAVNTTVLLMFFPFSKIQTEWIKNIYVLLVLDYNAHVPLCFGLVKHKHERAREPADPKPFTFQKLFSVTRLTLLIALLFYRLHIYTVILIKKLASI